MALQSSFRVELQAALGALKQGDHETYNAFINRFMYTTDDLYSALVRLNNTLPLFFEGLQKASRFPEKDCSKMIPKIETNAALADKVRADAEIVARLLK